MKNKRYTQILTITIPLFLLAYTVGIGLVYVFLLGFDEVRAQSLSMWLRRETESSENDTFGEMIGPLIGIGIIIGLFQIVVLHFSINLYIWTIIVVYGILITVYGVYLIGFLMKKIWKK